MAVQPKLQLLVAEIRTFFKANADAKIVEKYSRYFRDGYDAYGIPVALFLKKKDEWLRASEHAGLKGALDLADILFASPKYEEGALAIQFVSHFRGELKSATFKRVGGWLDSYVHNWAHCDVLCSEIVSHCLVDGIVTTKHLDPWLRAKARFKRRAGPVSLIALVKADREVVPLLDFVRPLMLDAERVVQQGLGWFLREAWKKNPKAVESFLMEWKDSAPRLIFQYATEKMPVAQRKRFAKAKAAPTI
ncbi:MAG TPA: DNA alkylation repair protein [Clostridia bacterium]|nr:DNA alkylation repair protein [Clostridia bacterium]